MRMRVEGNVLGQNHDEDQKLELEILIARRTKSLNSMLKKVTNEIITFFRSQRMLGFSERDE